MNAGRDFQTALEWAQANANATHSPRWLFQWNGFWWVSENPRITQTVSKDAYVDMQRIDPE